MGQLFGSPDIKKLEEKHNVKKLIKALLHPEKAVREESAAALGRIGDPRATVPLIKALRSDHLSVSSSAARALGKIGDSAAVPALIQMLNDGDEMVRWHAAWALEGIGDMRAEESLSVALGKRTPQGGNITRSAPKKPRDLN